jgi:hypothetical protein
MDPKLGLNYASGNRLAVTIKEIAVGQAAAHVPGVP